MADNSVFISGAAEGALAGALEGLPPWATEDTAKNIESILRKSLGIQTKALSELIKGAGGGKPMSPADAKKLDDELGSIIKNFGDANKDFGKQRKRWKDEADEHERKKKWWNKEFQINSKQYSLMGLYVALGEKIKDTMIENVKTFDELHASGINVMAGFDTAANGFEAMQQLAAITGVRFTELSATIVKYNAAINSFGLEKFAKTVSMSTKEMFKFGFTAKESAELLGAYLETQRGFVDLQSKTQAEVTADLVKFGERITKVSVATGMLRTQILANLDAVSKQVETSILAGRIGDEAAEKTAEFIASFKDQKVGQAFLKMMTDQIKPLNATFMDFQKIGFGGFGQKLMNFTQSLQGLEPEEAQRRVAEFMAANKQEIGIMRQRANLYSQLGMREADGVLSTITGLEQQARAYKKVSEKERKQQELASAASKALQTSWETFKAQLQITFAPLPVILDKLTYILEKLNEGADMVRGWFSGLDDFINSFKGVKETFGEVKSLNIVGNFIAVTAALVGLAATVSGVTKMFKFMFSTLFGIGKKSKIVERAGGFAEGAAGAAGGRNRDRGGPGILEKLGKGIASIGKGLGAGFGGLVGGFLKGLAEGLTAMGTTQVMKGALALIGVSSALWITGKAVKEFVNVRWEDLGKAGTALLGITAAGLVLSRSAPMMIVGATGLGILAGSLYVAGKAVQQFVGIDWGDMAKAGATLATLSGIGLLLGKASPMMIVGALGLGLMGGALWVAGKAVKQFENLKWDTIKKGGVVLAGLGVMAAAAGAVAPLILAGSAAFVALGASIFVVGKGLEAAGPGIKAVAEGISDFGKIDGNNLMAVAKGIGLLSGSLLAFTGSSVLGSVGNLFASIGNGISKLLGNDSVINQLKDFASAGPGLQMAAASFSSISLGLKMMSDTIDKFTGLDKLKSIVNTINTIDPTKAAAFSQAGKLGNISLPDLKTTAGTSRLSNPKPSELNSPSEMSSKQNAGKDGPIDAKKSDIASGTGLRKENSQADINTVIGYQTSVLEQILQSTNNLVSVNQDILKYTRVQS